MVVMSVMPSRQPAVQRRVDYLRGSCRGPARSLACGRMRRPVSTWARELACERSVAGGVVGGSVVPAAPEDAQPGGAEGADGALVVVVAGVGVGVDLGGPGVPVAGAVGEGADGVAQALVAGAAEDGDLALAGL